MSVCAVALSQLMSFSLCCIQLCAAAKENMSAAQMRPTEHGYKLDGLNNEWNYIQQKQISNCTYKLPFTQFYSELLMKAACVYVCLSALTMASPFISPNVLSRYIVSVWFFKSASKAEKKKIKSVFVWIWICIHMCGYFINTSPVQWAMATGERNVI